MIQCGDNVDAGVSDKIDEKTVAPGDCCDVEVWALTLYSPCRSPSLTARQLCGRAFRRRITSHDANLSLVLSFEISRVSCCRLDHGSHPVRDLYTGDPLLGTLRFCCGLALYPQRIGFVINPCLVVPVYIAAQAWIQVFAWWHVLRSGLPSVESCSCGWLLQSFLLRMEAT